MRPFIMRIKSGTNSADTDTARVLRSKRKLKPAGNSLNPTSSAAVAPVPVKISAFD
jgi:hypothetical protein